MKIRKIELGGGPAHYVFEDVTETDLQIFARAFEYIRPYSDIPELDVFSNAIANELLYARDQMLERYK